MRTLTVKIKINKLYYNNNVTVIKINIQYRSIKLSDGLSTIARTTGSGTRLRGRCSLKPSRYITAYRSSYRITHPSRYNLELTLSLELRSPPRDRWRWKDRCNNGRSSVTNPIVLATLLPQTWHLSSPITTCPLTHRLSYNQD
jgi:hypothetical protein